MGPRCHYCYLLTRALSDGGCRYYVGIRTCPKGKTPATDTSYMGGGPWIRRAVKAHPGEFTKTIVETFDTIAEAKAMERALVGPATANSPWSYNLMEGGGSGGRASEETKARMSAHRVKRWKDPDDRRRVVEALRGQKRSEQTRERMSRAHRGRKLSQEHIEKMRLAGLGRRHTEEAKAKMSAAQRGRVVSEETRAKMRAAALRRIATPDGRAQMEQLARIGGAARRRGDAAPTGR
ncbi:MAG: hypothetical protein GC161_16320 [Planctomycetaceae bacterium]|nr:hypothetical protein [Planctomycetaceae bacterium]